MMASSAVLLLQLLLASLAAASHNYGGLTTYSYKGRNPDGSYRVTLRNKDTFRGCSDSHYWACYSGDCGHLSSSNRGTIDSSPNGPAYNSPWCESETFQTRTLYSDKPFQMWAYSCCWVNSRNGMFYWNLETLVDLGNRSDTKAPNRSPDIAILPLLRVPANCPRTYNLMAVDPDGDKVRCRYGNMPGLECSTCNQPSGFHLDQDTCTLQYQSASAHSYDVFGFEMVVEDFPQGHIRLTYSDGTQSYRAPPTARRKRQATTTYPTTAAPTTSWWWWSTTTAAPTTSWWWWSTTTTAPTTTDASTTSWWWWSTTTPPTTAAPTTSWWWWSTTTAAPTTSWWWWSTTTPPTTAAPTTTYPPTTTTYPPTATTYPPTTNTYPPTTNTYPPTTTTYPPTTTTYAPPTTAAPTTSWWWWTTSTPPTTAAPTTPWWWWTTTTDAPTTTDTPTTPWWWWSTPAPTTSWWWWSTPATSTTAAPTTPWWWWSTPATSTTPAPTTSWWWWSTPAPTTTAAPTTPWWWWSTPATSTTAAPTVPWWWWSTAAPTTTAAPTVPWWWYSTTTSVAHTTAPLSKLPMQFSVLVDSPAPSCQEGLYIPQFVQPTPENGARIYAEVDKEMEIRVRAVAQNATIQDMMMSGPLNISKHRTTHNEFVIRWTPQQDDLGDQFPVCFAVEAVVWSQVFQSNMRCVLVDTTKPRVRANVICGESSMRVEVAKSEFSGIHENHLRLSDPTNTICSLQTHSNSTHVIAVVPLNACGTQIEEDEDSLIFKNEITTFDDTRDLITRKHLLEVQFDCQYPKKGNVTLGFTAHRKSVTVWEKGLGTFTYQFEFYPTEQFQTMINPRAYPLEYEVGQRIYMEIEATSSLNNTEMFVESCRAAPYDNPNYRPTYSIIENGCNVDPTVQIHSPRHNKHFQFSMEAFKFIGMFDQVYISCSVVMCESGNPNTRCARGCMNSTSNHVRKRDAVIETGSHFVSQGPLRLKRSADSSGGAMINLNLNMAFIAGCLLAAIGMICGVAVYKAKMSRVQYKPLPTWET
ncbi:uncharacterized protein LOC114432951 isoform X2 [Parambassis ranga]|uniref:Uncharacterized protein LOC114432951 isoform X2 n=1 Tax=Parambassis ranga TaxID=210632 RepID=A0A6P7HT96_9TELE|nr:uncharacterized protein LOC114432951 isoform X2 [Parambassis ranga]